MRVPKQLKEYKFLHWAYNLIHYKSLRHNKKAYREYHVHKPLIGSISSKDFPDKESKAWLDVGHSKNLAQTKSQYKLFPKNLQDQLFSWSDNGFIILEKFFDDAKAESINIEIGKLVQQKKLRPTHDNKLMFANRVSPLIKSISHEKKLLDILSFILDREVVPFQTINFIYGSGQRAHSDSIHMTTYPLGYLIAVWIALEDTNMDNGALFYYPGSHRMPYLLNGDFDQVGSSWKLGNKDYPDYEDAIEKQLMEKKLEKKIFLAKKGDILIWHGNLAHGGLPITNPTLTRKSMVIHYYAKDVIKYHEISERPSLIEPG